MSKFDGRWFWCHGCNCPSVKCSRAPVCWGTSCNGGGQEPCKACEELTEAIQESRQMITEGKTAKDFPEQDRATYFSRKKSTRTRT